MNELEQQIAALQKAGATREEIAQFVLAHQQADPQGAPSTTADKLHAEYKAGTLGGRMARENANERDATDAETPGYGTQVAGGIASLAHAIPGAEAVQAGARSVVRRQPYTEALSDIQGAEQDAPKSVRVFNNLAGAAPLATMLPGSPATAGAIIGGADQALAAEPMSIGERGARTVAGTAIGALTGRAADRATTLARALFAKNPATNILAKQAARASSARQLYSAAIAEGQGNTATPAIDAFLKEPDIAEIVTELKGTRPFQGVAENSPEMLDAVYKTLSDRAGVVRKGMESVTPNRPNIGRFRGEDIQAAKQQAMGAMAGTPSAPGPMPSYQQAVQDYAQRTQEIQALQRGYQALVDNISGRLPSAKNLTRKTPQAFSEWAGTASPTETSGATEGLLGGTRAAFGAKQGWTQPVTRHALSVTPDLVRRLQGTRQPLFDVGQNLALLLGGGYTQP